MSDELARQLMECYQRKHWLETELEDVNARATEIIEQIRGLPYVAGLERHADPAAAQTERFRVPDYVIGEHTYGRATVAEQSARHMTNADGSGTFRLNPVSDSTARMVAPVDCPDTCRELARHIHTADGAVHPVDVS